MAFPFRKAWSALGVTVVPCALLVAAQTQPVSDRPNVVLIFMDDLGYGDLGSYGATDVRTPNIDTIAKRGVRLTQAYANAAVCSPTRAALMTGRYQQRVGLEWALGDRGPDTARGLVVNAASLPLRLKNAGYATGLFGKWHLGVRKEFGPNAHGFDEFFGFLGGALDYYNHSNGTGDPDLFENTTPTQATGYLTDLISQRAVGFIDRHAAKPFFVEVAFSATHWPFQPPDHPPTDDEQKQHPTLYEVPGEPGAHTRRDYVEMLQRADQGVGTVIAALERNHVLDRTLVIFTDDNGGEWLSRNAPFSGQKSTLFEGGIRVPLIMEWSRHLPVGRTSEQVAITMDITASILSACGAGPAKDFPLDGIDLVPLLSGTRPLQPRELFWRINQPTRVQRAVRSGQWKLLIEGSGVQDGLHPLLFNLSTDPAERRDVAASEQSRVAALRARFAEWESDVAMRFGPPAR